MRSKFRTGGIIMGCLDLWFVVWFPFRGMAVMILLLMYVGGKGRPEIQSCYYFIGSFYSWWCPAKGLELQPYVGTIGFYLIEKFSIQLEKRTTRVPDDSSSARGRAGSLKITIE